MSLTFNHIDLFGPKYSFGTIKVDCRSYPVKNVD